MKIKVIFVKKKKVLYCFCFICLVNEEGMSDEFQGMFLGCIFYMCF